MNSQEELLEIIPRIFNKLKCSTVDTLKEYQVEYRHVQVAQQTTDVAQELVKIMHKEDAIVLEQQAGREFRKKAPVAKFRNS